MRYLAIPILVLALAACGETESLRVITVASSSQHGGLALREVPSAMLRSLKLSYGLTVVKAGEAAERAGLRVGDVVFGVEQKRISSLEDFYRAVADRRGDTLRLLVRRGGSDLHVPVDFSSGLPGVPSKDRLLRT
ncbi:MAG: PDZ domain-containing protein [Betaproteobacteria bacterium]